MVILSYFMAGIPAELPNISVIDSLASEAVVEGVGSAFAVVFVVCGVTVGDVVFEYSVVVLSDVLDVPLLVWLVVVGFLKFT